MSTMKLGICTRCINGQLFMESHNESCKECARTGATVCRNCEVVFEIKCLQCGNMENEYTVKREHLGKVRK